jgi:hypothetical protein
MIYYLIESLDVDVDKTILLLYESVSTSFTKFVRQTDTGNSIRAMFNYKNYWMLMIGMNSNENPQKIQLIRYSLWPDIHNLGLLQIQLALIQIYP